MLIEHKLTPGNLWIDLLDPSPEEIERIKITNGIRVPPRSELEEIESSSRLSKQGNVLYMNMPVTTIDGDGKLSPAPVGFVLSDKILVTIHFAQLHAMSKVFANLKADGNALSSADVFAMVIEAMVDFGADQLENIAGDIMGISQRVFRRTEAPRREVEQINRLLRNTLSVIGFAGEHLSQIRESALGLLRTSTFAWENCQDWNDKRFLDRLETARTDLQSLIDYETHLSDKTQFLLDATLGFINTQQNDIFKVLTIVSVAGIPPTLIAGMYGMNFHNMPELSWAWGYQYGLALIAASTIIPMIWFKWRGWW